MGVVRGRNDQKAVAKPISRRMRTAMLAGVLGLLVLGGRLTARCFFGPVPVQNAAQLPVGLILPVRLENTLEVQEAHQGTPLETRLMQEVPLPEQKKFL